MSTLIKGGTVVTASDTFQADVLVEGETIAAVGRGLRGDTVIDATGTYVIPGGIDVHTHLDMPFGGTVSSDDFFTGHRAAALDGDLKSAHDLGFLAYSAGAEDQTRHWWEYAARGGHVAACYHLGLLLQATLPRRDDGDLGSGEEAVRQDQHQDENALEQAPLRHPTAERPGNHSTARAGASRTPS